MKSVSDDLRAILGSAQFHMADCYTFILADGTIARYTTADSAITDRATGHVFAASGPFFERSKVKFQTGVQVDELDIAVTAGPADIMFPGGPSWLPGLRCGVLDGAELQLDRAFMPAFGDISAGLVTLFYGRVVEVDVGRTQATIKVNTHLELLNLQWPWRLFQPGCSRTLFDAGCTLVKSAFGQNYTAVSGSTPQVLHTDYNQPDGTAALGTLTFRQGALTGRSFQIQSQTGGLMSLLTPLPSLPAPGDGILVYPGCDKTQATCKNKFSNLQHYQGEPYVPVPETAA
jgi:uncharacterized phage protein (TIGR02218 family)